MQSIPAQVNSLVGTKCHLVSLLWKGQDEWRIIFLKYSPHPLSYSTRYYNAADYEDLTERQRHILEPPNARY